ncbi:hypothetical protein [Ramlibacter humi]|uniref:Uncharacterized protein n=1 Tax=Ramlibacter humi TaxID=2530451 RepID=A0A4Z0BUZ9_9BURK|nr:hypothetical protein [Ramlibacter humi]TFZ02098.1 hypothetical protein EZ216_13060 [Ramlibacter humi]
MSLRDHFALQALPAILAHFQNGHPFGWHGIAGGAYMVADALLEARQAASGDEYVAALAQATREAEEALDREESGS